MQRSLSLTVLTVALLLTLLEIFADQYRPLRANHEA